VLLSRDTSLRFALKTLLSEHDTVSELQSPKGWRSLNGTPVDAVVVDLPPSLRTAAVESLRRKFTGPLVVLLDLGEDLDDDASRLRCAVLHRPFGMAELWSLLTSDRYDISDISYEQAQVGELTEPMPAVRAEEDGGNGAAPAPQAAEAPGPAAAAEPMAPAESAVAAEPALSTESTGPTEPIESASHTAPSAGVAVGPASAVGPADDDRRPTSLTRAAIWEAVDEAPQAVAARLAQRLQTDVVALLLDNGEGVLETAGGVGLEPTERRLQVEYGHNVLSELFRVGVGLINDTERVHRVIEGLPIGQADTLMMVPLAHEGHGFGVLLAGRYRPPRGSSNAEFTELEIEALMDFAEDVAPALRSAILLRRLKGQLNLAEGL